MVTLTLKAALKLVLPAWLAVMVQSPRVRTVMVALLIRLGAVPVAPLLVRLQMPALVVLIAKLTALPLAPPIAVMATLLPMVVATWVGGLKVMVWLPAVMVRLRLVLVGR